MRVAVTGASGFLGRHVVEALLAQGAEVIAIGRQPQADASGAVKHVQLDIDAPGDITLARLGNPELLVHLAWGGLPNYSSPHHVEQELPRHAAFLDACLDAGLPRLAVAGTCLEYGLQSGALSEDTPARPTTAYALAKHRLHEHLLQRQGRSAFGLGWYRLFYLYGPGQSPSSLYRQLRAAVDGGAESFDMSPGDQQRDFLPVEQAAEYLATLALGQANPGTVNISSGRPVGVEAQVREWLREWQAAGLRLNLGVRAYPDYEAFAFWGDPGKRQQLMESR